MADLGLVRRDYEMAKLSNFRIDGYVAAIRKRDPKKSWFLKPVIDHDEFKRLSGSTSDLSLSGFLTASQVAASKERKGLKEERNRKRKVKEAESNNPAASKVQSKGKEKEKVESKNPAESKVERKRKGNEAESKNLAGKVDSVNNNLAFDIEEDFDNITLGDFLRKQKALKVEKNKKKVLEVEEPRLCVAKPWPPGSAPWMREPATEVGAAWVRALEMALAEPWDPEDLVCSINKNPAEFNTQTAKGFMRRVFDLNLGT